MPATVWDNAFKGAAVVLHVGDVQAETSAYGTVLGTNGKTTGKWSFCIRNDIINPPQNPVVGIGTHGILDLNQILGLDHSYAYVSGSGDKIAGGVEVPWAGTWNSVGVELQIYVDFDAGTIGAMIDGVDQGNMFSGITVGTYYPAMSCGSSGGAICNSTIRRTASEYSFPSKTGYTPWDDTPAAAGGNFLPLL